MSEAEPPETVWTSRRALLHSPTGWTRGRLRVSDRAVRFTARDGATTEIALAAVVGVRVARVPRRTLLLETEQGPIRLRCFAVPAVAALLLHGSRGLEAR